tara:strand:- start:7 stop:759 length:753 start_codon:yes stop_codon:yes gene_type:complete
VRSNFFCKSPYINLYDQPSYNSNIGSQILYGEKFKILLKKKNFYKIKISYDNYVGYIKLNKYIDKFKPTHKVSALKSRIFKYPKNQIKYKSKKSLPFLSNIQIIKKNKNFVMYEKNKWLNIKDIKLINQREKNFIKILNLFKNCKYKWGGKTFNGIDCSALIQIFYQYNNKFFPRDTKDQIKYSKKNLKRKNFKKGDLIFWKGHVAVCLNTKKLFHAYGPKKRVIIMPIRKTIDRIEKTANLRVRKISRI